MKTDISTLYCLPLMRAFGMKFREALINWLKLRIHWHLWAPLILCCVCTPHASRLIGTLID